MPIAILVPIIHVEKMIFVIVFIKYGNVDTTPVNVEESLDSENEAAKSDQTDNEKTICKNAIVLMEVNSVFIILSSRRNCKNILICLFKSTIFAIYRN